jgi:hypothetical protein
MHQNVRRDSAGEGSDRTEVREIRECELGEEAGLIVAVGASDPERLPSGGGERRGEVTRQKAACTGEHHASRHRRSL